MQLFHLNIHGHHIGNESYVGCLELPSDMTANVGDELRLNVRH